MHGMLFYYYNTKLEGKNMERGGLGGDFVLSENANKYYFLYCREGGICT